MHLNHSKTIPFHPGPWKNCLPQNWAAAQRTGTTALVEKVCMRFCAAI